MYQRITAAESERDQRLAAAALRRRGVTPGDRVAIIAGNSAVIVNIALGALRTGIVPVIVNADLLDHEQRVILDDCRPSLVLRGDDAFRLIADAEAGADARAGRPASVELAAAPLGRPMHYTSGTTGRPKGVWSGVLSEDDALGLLLEERNLWSFGEYDINLVCSPLYHSAPLRFAAGTLLAGGDIVVLDKFSPESAAAAIQEHRPTTTFTAPSHLQRLFASERRVDLSCFRLVAHAGAPCPVPLKEDALKRFPDGAVWEFYGSTEGQFTACPSADWLSHPGTVGRARPGRTLSIDDGGTIWCEVPPHARFSYWDDPGKTEAAWRGDAFSVFDVGRLDDDGFLFLDGRRDDLIITGGVNVYPLEIEIALATLPGVQEVAVFGIDDERWGQKVCAAVVGSVTPASVRAYATQVLAPYKRPKAVWPVAEIPKSATGKVRRSTLAADLGLT